MTSANHGTQETYIQIRERNIAANRNLLLSLQLSGPGLTPKLIPKTNLNNANIPNQKDSNLPRKTRKIRNKSTFPSAVSEANQVNPDGRRRSGRILNQLSQQNQSQQEESSDEEEDYEARDSDCSDDSDTQDNHVAGQGKKRKSVWHPPREPKRPRGGQPPQRKAKSLKGSRPDPKIFGHQIGTEVGDWWDSRMMCSQAGVHAPPVSGIAGTDGVGCYSVALSGGYEDDVDLGYAFTFTGAGGRALSGTPNNPKNLRTAPQSFDQEFTSVNAALKLSCEKKNPVRVIRGYKNHSPFAPEEGYRYDGLYKVEKCWREPGQSGFQVCKFAFVRLPDQPRIPVKKGREAEAEQMYQDMGFELKDLPPLPEERQIWTQSLAKQRRQAQCEEKLEETEDLHAQKDIKEDPIDLSEQRHDEENEADQPIPHDVDMKTENFNTHSQNGAHHSIEVSIEKEDAKTPETRGINSNIDLSNSNNASNQPQTEKEEYETNQKAVTDQLNVDPRDSTEASSEQENTQEKETHDINLRQATVEDDLKVDKSDQANFSEQVQEEKCEQLTEGNSEVGAKNHIGLVQQQSNGIHLETVAGISKQGENGQVEHGSSSSAAPVNGHAANFEVSNASMS